MLDYLVQCRSTWTRNSIIWILKTGRRPRKNSTSAKERKNWNKNNVNNDWCRTGETQTGQNHKSHLWKWKTFWSLSQWYSRLFGNACRWIKVSCFFEWSYQSPSQGTFKFKAGNAKWNTRLYSVDYQREFSRKVMWWPVILCGNDKLHLRYVLKPLQIEFVDWEDH